MSAIGPGDWVECVRESVEIPGALTVGTIYRVTSIHQGPFPGGAVMGIDIAGVNARSRFGFDCRLFRPIYRPKSELLESLLRKSDEPVKEMV